RPAEPNRRRRSQRAGSPWGVHRDGSRGADRIAGNRQYRGGSGVDAHDGHPSTPDVLWGLVPGDDLCVAGTGPQREDEMPGELKPRRRRGGGRGRGRRRGGARKDQSVGTMPAMPEGAIPPVPADASIASVDTLVDTMRDPYEAGGSRGSMMERAPAA